MPSPEDRLPLRLERLEMARQARALGLPALLAERVAEIVAGSDLPDDKRSEVFREMVGHFEDGLAAGRSPEELSRAFGDSRTTAQLIRAEKRIVTPESLGGAGSGDGVLAALARDVRYAVRRLAARPAFTVIAILSLAIGIGANAAMFTLVNDVILRRAPLERPEELVDIYRSNEAWPYEPLPYPEYRDLAARNDLFTGVTAASLSFAMRTDGDQVERLAVQLVSGNYFGELGIGAARGRLIAPEDADATGRSPVVVLSDRYWRRAFAADPSVVGRTLRLSGSTYTVIGVTHPDFPGTFPTIGIELYMPVTMTQQLISSTDDVLESRGNNAHFVRARLAPGVTLAQVRSALDATAARLHEDRVEGWRGVQRYTALPTREVILYPPVDRLIRPIAAIMMGVVGMVLLIACANLAGFLLARAVDRRKEVAVRLALGATRRRLVFQLLIETLLLAAVGGAAGLLLGRALLSLVLAADLPLPIPLGIGLTLDARVVTFLVAVSAVAGIAFGLVPALQATRLDLASIMREEGTGGGRSRGRLRQSLVVAQVAVSVVLLMAAGLFVRSMHALRSVDPGVGGAPVALLMLGAPAGRTPDENRQRLDRLVARLATLPDVRGVGRSSNVHLNLLSFATTTVNVDGVPAPTGEVGHTIDEVAIDSGFFGAMGMRLLHGRNFVAADADTSRRVAIVNEAFVRQFWPGEDGVGRRVRWGDGTALEIVGVVNTARIRTLAEAPTPVIYRPLHDNTNVWVAVRSGTGAGVELARLVSIARELDPDALVYESRTLERHIGIMSLPLSLGANALGAFALVALVMASIGLYGTVSYSVAQRSREVGIRLSLGATTGGVVRLLTWDGVRLVVVGALIGVALGLLFGRALEGFLYGASALDPVGLASVPAVLIVVALVAAYLPARRAGRIDPVRAIRAE